MVAAGLQAECASQSGSQRENESEAERAIAHAGLLPPLRVLSSDILRPGGFSCRGTGQTLPRPLLLWLSAPDRSQNGDALTALWAIIWSSLA
jgi:hypothetical protein